MNEHSISYMQKCMAHDFNDYENLVICRDLLAQISKRPMPQGMDYDPKSDSYEEDVRRECGRIDFHLRRFCILTMNALPPMRLCRRMTL